MKKYYIKPLAQVVLLNNEAVMGLTSGTDLSEDKPVVNDPIQIQSKVGVWEDDEDEFEE